MELRAVCAGCAAMLVVVMGAGTVGASPRGLVVEAMPPMAQASPVNALTEDQAVAMLAAEGYRVVDTHRTWLGRIVITAEGKAGKREIVLHPYDGQVLRDVIVEPADPPLGAATTEEVAEDPEVPAEEQAAEAVPDVVAVPLIPAEPAP